MNNSIKSIFFSCVTILVLQACGGLEAKKSEKEEVKGARRTIQKFGTVASLSAKMMGALDKDPAKSPLKTSAKNLFLVIKDLSDLGLKLLDMRDGKAIKVGDTTINFNALQTRLSCLSSKNDAELKKAFAADDKSMCANVGCTDAENCYLLVIRDMVYTVQLLMESFIGKLVEGKTKAGAKEMELDPGLCVSFIEFLIPLIKSAGKGVGSGAIRKQLDMLEERFEKMKGSAATILQALAPVPPVCDIMAIGLGNDLDMYIDLPKITKDKLKISVDSSGIKDLDFDVADMNDEIREDIKGFDFD